MVSPLLRERRGVEMSQPRALRDGKGHTMEIASREFLVEGESPGNGDREGLSYLRSVILEDHTVILGVCHTRGLYIRSIYQKIAIEVCRNKDDTVMRSVSSKRNYPHGQMLNIGRHIL